MSDQSPRRLKRSSDDRILSGVCGGLGNYFSVDPLILRIAFAVSVFFGGLGIVLYLALAVLVPVDDAPDGKPLIVLGRSEAIAIVVTVAALVVAIPLFGALFVWVGDPGIIWPFALVVLIIAAVMAWRDRSKQGRSGPSTDLQPAAPAAEQDRVDDRAAVAEQSTDVMPTRELRSPGDAERGAEASVADDSASGADRRRKRSNWLTVLLVCSTALLSLAAFFAAALTVGFGLGALVAAMIAAGGLAVFALAFATGTAGRWLIAPLVAMVLGAGAAEAADLDLEGGMGEKTHRPPAAASIPEEGYRLGAGHLKIDLRGTDLREGQRVPLKAGVGAGLVEVIVPPDVCVVGEARARAGFAAFLGDENNGFSVVSEDQVPSVGGPQAVAPSAAKDAGPGKSSGGSDGKGADLGPAVVEVDAEVDFGAVQIRNDGSSFDAGREAQRWHSAKASNRMRRLNERACAG